MRVAIVSTYLPRPCGIAVFSSDLRAALQEADSSLSVEIVSIVREDPQSHPPEVVETIHQDHLSDYPAAAAKLNQRNLDVVVIEHEYGIFGGDSGNYILKLTDELTVPMVVTLHTVLADPPPHRAQVLRALCDRAALVMVFTETARRMVVEQGLVEFERVRVVPHGAPDELTYAAWSDGAAEEITSSPLQLSLPNLAGKFVLSTFGLISDSKGLELVIRALPAITAVHPEVLYLIAGQTHPDVINKEGETYRLGLQRLVHDLDLCDHVWFIDRFLSTNELAMLLARTDLYLTPYRSKDQIVSGALTFAVAAGCPVVSTPYLYAEDLLGSGAGVLVPFGDPSKLAAAVLELLGSPAKLHAARAEARRVGADLPWASVGKATLELLAEASHGVRLMGANARSR
jgi:glycosyltransferase involved in cell wall biosynthesis